MLFWKKDTAKEICDLLRTIRKEVGKIEGLANQKVKLIAVINTISRLINKVKEDILKIARKQKAKSWIDVRFDSSIDYLAEGEILCLEKFLRDIQEYGTVCTTVQTTDDFSALISLIEDELKAIETRDWQNKVKIEEFENETLKERLQIPSSHVPPLRTLDKTPWKNIVQVARELGGCVIHGGHSGNGQISFPKSTRGIVISKDIDSTALANLFRKQLANFMPSHKIPNASVLRRAFTNGDIRQTA